MELVHPAALLISFSETPAAKAALVAADLVECDLKLLSMLASLRTFLHHRDKVGVVTGLCGALKLIKSWI